MKLRREKKSNQCLLLITHFIEEEKFFLHQLNCCVFTVICRLLDTANHFNDDADDDDENDDVFLEVNQVTVVG